MSKFAIAEPTTAPPASERTDRRITCVTWKRRGAPAKYGMILKRLPTDVLEVVQQCFRSVEARPGASRKSSMLGVYPGPIGCETRPQR